MFDISKKFRNNKQLVEEMVNLNEQGDSSAWASFYHRYPKKWIGFVAGHEVEIIQSTLDRFRYEKFPEEYSYIKSEIEGWIDEFVKRED